MASNPYQTLGVSQTASQDEIKNAYRKLAKKLHPDLNPGNKDAEKKFKEVNAAYEKVGTPEMRAKFDRGELEEEATAGARGGGPFYHQTQREGGRYSQHYSNFGGGADMDEDLFQSIFGRMGGRGGARGAAGAGNPFEDAGGRDALYRMDVTFKDAVLGAEREITLPDGRRLRVKIPPGVDTGARLRFPGYGAAAAGNGPAGDAYVELDVKPSSLFKRSGQDLEVELPISVAESLLGAEVKAPTLEGAIMLKVPPGASTGQKLRATGKGVPRSGGSRGDLYYILKLVAPKETDADFKAAVEAWSKRQPYDARANWGGERE